MTRMMPFFLSTRHVKQLTILRIWSHLLCQRIWLTAFRYISTRKSQVVPVQTNSPRLVPQVNGSPRTHNRNMRRNGIVSVWIYVLTPIRNVAGLGSRCVLRLRNVPPVATGNDSSTNISTIDRTQLRCNPMSAANNF